MHKFNEYENRTNTNLNVFILRAQWVKKEPCCVLCECVLPGAWGCRELVGACRCVFDGMRGRCAAGRSMGRWQLVEGGLSSTVAMPRDSSEVRGLLIEQLSVVIWENLGYSSDDTSQRVGVLRSVFSWLRKSRCHLILCHPKGCPVSFFVTLGRFVGVRPFSSVKIRISRGHNTPGFVKWFCRSSWTWSS
jgi:hypothetical protein